MLHYQWNNWRLAGDFSCASVAPVVHSSRVRSMVKEKLHQLQAALPCGHGAGLSSQSSSLTSGLMSERPRRLAATSSRPCMAASISAVKPASSRLLGSTSWSTRSFTRARSPCPLATRSRGDINVFYLVRPGPSSFAFFSRKKVGSRKFFCPKGQKFFFRGKYTL